MVVKKRVAKAGYEPFFDMANKKLETIEDEIKARIETEVAAEKDRLNNIIMESSIEVEEEVPDEEPVAEDTVEAPVENQAE